MRTKYDYGEMNPVYGILNMPQCRLYVVESAGLSRPEYIGEAFNTLFFRARDLAELTKHVKKAIHPHEEHGVPAYTINQWDMYNPSVLGGARVIDVCSMYGNKRRIVTMGAKSND